MSFLDRVTKAVSETVDRGKKEVDQFVRIQKVKGEITAAEKTIDEARNRIQQIKLRLADSTIEMLQAQTLTSPELSTFLDQLGVVDQEIAAQQAVIAKKRDEVEQIKAEDEGPKTAPTTAAAPFVAPPPVPTPADAPAGPAAVAEGSAPVAEGPAMPPPLPTAETSAAAARVCPQCGHPVGDKAAFCGECGMKLGAM